MQKRSGYVQKRSGNVQKRSDRVAGAVGEASEMRAKATAMPWTVRGALLLAAVSASLVCVSGVRGQTIGYYRFEEGPEGDVQSYGYGDPADRRIVDSSGRGNNFQSFHNGFYSGGPNDFTTSPAYRTDPPTPTVPGFGNATNLFSMDFRPRNGGERYDLYSSTSDDLNTYNFTQITIEATVRFSDVGGYQTIIGKDGQNWPNSFGPLANLYFQLQQDGGHERQIALKTHNSDGSFVEAYSDREVVPGVWYNLMGVNDGTTSRVYMKRVDEQYYTGGRPRAVNGLSVNNPNVPGENRVWTIGRGFFDNNIVDFYRGFVDEVRLSANALSTTQGLFPAEVARPAPLAVVSLPAARLQYALENNANNTGTLNSGNYDGTQNGVATFVSGTHAAAVGQYAHQNGGLVSGVPQDGNFSVPAVDVADPTANGDFTFGAWVKSDTSTNPQQFLQMIVANASTYPYNGFKFYINNNSRSLTLEINAFGGFSSGANTVPADGKFHYLSFTFQRSGDSFANSYGRVFVDGVDVTGSNGVPQAGVGTNGPLTFGDQSPNANEPFPLVGAIDQAEFYGGRLSAMQMKVLGAPRWRDDVSGVWQDDNFNGASPDGFGNVVRFGDRITAPRTVTLASNHTTGYVIFDSAVPYTLASSGGGTLNLDGGISGVAVQALAGSHVISAPVTVQGGLTLDTAPGSSIGITGSVSTANPTVQIVKSGAGQVVLSGSVTHTGSVTVLGGNLTLSGAAKLTGGGSLSVASGASVDINTTPGSSPRVVLNVINPLVNDGATLRLGQTGNGLTRTSAAQNVAVVSNLVIGFNGTFDLSDNDLIVRVPSLAAMQPTLDAYRFVVNRWLTSGAFGLTSSTADSLAAAAGHRVTTLAVFPNYVPDYDAGYFESYDGVPLGKYDLVVKYAFVGDFNLDGVVDGADAKILAESYVFGATGGWNIGDVNYDGVVNDADVTAFDAVYGTLGSNSLGSGAGTDGSAQSIPEAGAGAMLLSVGGACLLSRRRR